MRYGHELWRRSRQDLLHHLPREIRQPAGNAIGDRRRMRGVYAAAVRFAAADIREVAGHSRQRLAHVVNV
jgi:hypothetical protein